MTDKTIESITNQINSMGARYYDIGVYFRPLNNMIIKYKLELKDIIKNVPWLKYKNMIGNDIFIKPDPSEERALVLIDDINMPNILSMKKRGVSPACVIETSPNNYQVWVSLGNEPLHGQYIKCIASLFAKEFIGDPACGASSHFGRLAGFTNKKKQYLLNNKSPFVLCLEYTGIHAEKSFEIRLWAERQIVKQSKKPNFKLFTNSNLKLILDTERTFLKYFDSWIQNTLRYHKEVDFSRGDFAVACRMIKEGYLREDIIISMIKNSPNIHLRKNKHIQDYATRTVDSAIIFCN
ncbi:MAG: RepB family DNA primase [Clostridiales Family XIII bacterium]|jgi:hypothetical protein|nr:RepB family DNA primase [Clostridiales Family XIII bacterium]